jgi:hypothetical protein
MAVTFSRTLLHGASIYVDPSHCGVHIVGFRMFSCSSADYTLHSSALSFLLCGLLFRLEFWFTFCVWDLKPA